MDHDQLAARIEHRLEMIEAKLDKHLELVSSNKADINWLKGSIRLGATAVITIFAGLITAIIKIFYGN